jgi:D-arabinose 1-dehydrogenase-like Zn-dependent alcohol dehydrogenase
MGIRPIVVDTGDERNKLTKELGAEAFVDFKTSEDTVAEVIKLCDGIGAHGVFVTAPQTYPTALNYLGSRVNGTVMCIGLPPAGQFTVSLAIIPIDASPWRANVVI